MQTVVAYYIFLVHVVRYGAEMYSDMAS